MASSVRSRWSLVKWRFDGQQRGMQFNFGLKSDAAVKLAIASHFLAGTADTLSSETDTVIAAVVLAACIFYVVPGTRVFGGRDRCRTLLRLFGPRALEADKFTNTFVWVATA